MAHADSAARVREVLVDAAGQTPTTASRRRAGRAILDGVAVALAGTAEPVAEVARAALSDVDGPGASAIWGASATGSVGSAVFANAVAAHALAWDDYTQPMYGHCTAVLLPVCAALADARGADGAAVVDAYLAGYEINGRLGEVLGTAHYDRGWHATSTIGTIGAAVAAGRLLGLDRAQLWSAMGIAASAAAGFQGNFGSMAKSLHTGQAARAGLTAARLALRGATANPDWLLGDTGYLAVMGVDDREGAVATLLGARDGGLVIEGEWGLVQKLYCCCGSAQPMIRAIVTLVEDNDILAEEVEAVEVHVDPAVLTLLVHDRPATPTEGRYCLPYLAAVAAVDRAAGPAQFTASSIARDDLERMMARVHHLADRTSPPETRYRAEVAIRTPRGTFEHAADVPDGHPRAPLSQATLGRKFREGVETVLPAERGESLYRMLEGIDDITAWSEISTLLTLDHDPHP